jgi:hypothetical protein
LIRPRRQKKMNRLNTLLFIQFIHAGFETAFLLFRFPGDSGSNVIIFTIFCRLAFHLLIRQKNDHNVGFKEERQFFRRKLAK